MRRIQLFGAVTLLLNGAIALHAQDNSATNSIDTLNVKLEQVESEVSLIKKLKFSGYVQAQWQKADTIGTASVAGGDFKGLDNRFQVRRARLKAAYSGTNTTVAVQLDLKDDGSVKVKEAYGIYSEPLLNVFSLTGGYFNRPIGYEVEYSSSLLESPERSRIIQTLFPDEVDMGAKLTIQAPKNSPFNFIKLDAGLFNGNAINAETDKYKDIIAHLSLKKAVLNENLLLSGGFSYYKGGWALPVSSVTNAKLPHVYNANDTAFLVDSAYKVGDKIKRDYLGLDAQASFSTGLGLTTLRGEYLWGVQPGTKSSSTSPKGAMTGDIYNRNFSGGYITFLHRILQTKHEIIVKYDWYDPNTDLKGDAIGKAKSNSGLADLAYTTIGLGWNYYATANARLSVYYDMVSNEKSKYLIGANGTNNYSKDLKDNVLTVRVLYKF
jgi:hypothetical protein